MVAQVLAALLYLGVAQELAHDPLVRDELWKLLRDAHYGFASTEEAMFIIRGADGHLSFLRWKSSRIRHHARWTAPMPMGVIAIAHTHPNEMPRPSALDVQTAIRQQVPVYVVTRSRITRTNDGQEQVVSKGEWFR